MLLTFWSATIYQEILPGLADYDISLMKEISNPSHEMYLTVKIYELINKNIYTITDLSITFYDAIRISVYQEKTPSVEYLL